MNRISALFTMILLTTAVFPQSEATSIDTDEKGFRIDTPGTITFTVAMKIEGRIDKPQVMIFLPKEDRHFREITFSHTFEDEITSPLLFTPEPD